jgi:hypothetical protein
LLTAGKGTILEGDLEIHWKVAKADEDDSRMVRTVDYTISGPEGESYGGLRDQDDADGHPETEFYYVDQHGSGFAWTTGITYNHDSEMPRPCYLECDKVCALTNYEPNDKEAIRSISGEGWATQVVPVQKSDIKELLPIDPSALPVTGKDNERWTQETKDGTWYTYRQNNHGTTGTFGSVKSDFTGHWAFHNRDTKARERSVYVNSNTPGVGKVGFGLQESDGTMTSDGWLRPQ